MIRVFGLNAYEEEINEIRKKYVEYFGLRYGWKANKNLPFDQGHWNRPVIKKSKYFPFDMSEHPSFYLGHPEIAKIWDAINNELGGGRALVRAYVNGYTYGTDGYLHSDDAYTFQIAIFLNVPNGGESSRNLQNLLQWKKLSGDGVLPKFATERKPEK